MGGNTPSLSRALSGELYNPQSFALFVLVLATYLPLRRLLALDSRGPGQLHLEVSPRSPPEVRHGPPPSLSLSSFLRSQSAPRRRAELWNWQELAGFQRILSGEEAQRN